MPESHLLLSYYGDDFTGSTDVMEALASNGVATVLFTRAPTEREFRPFTEYRAIGLAGTSRSETPQWMDRHLTPAFVWLRQLGARLCHYKVCSTFDSSPAAGSIGKAIDIGRAVFGQRLVPLIVGAPQLRRYTAFGHLFAAYQDEVYRIDRHPVMSRHPVTPMTESDLRLHLAKQTNTLVHLLPLSFLAPAEKGQGEGDFSEGILLIDVIDAETQRAAGEAMLEIVQRHGPFIAGSSGVEYALLAALRARGELHVHTEFPALKPVDRMIAVSGSVSPTTERQIRHALAHGFEGMALDPLLLANDASAAEAAIAQGFSHLAAGRSVIAYTALGPSSDRGKDIYGDGRPRLGGALGRIARALIERAGLTRAVIAGGDTSSHALAELDIHALTCRYPLRATPGSPLCTAHSASAALNGMDIAMKGGQIGHDDYFTMLRDGIGSIAR